ncbi:chitin-binding domain protein cbd-1-like isoform X1 [Tigriopus californicus]|uniref:chitin-binding domain protein cbd-1-like isoform X1 n=1 Tax=Tigriopus californicus TaxID=6832 RepID=UPI0027DA9BD0|nr:chitin-binding domain protein cbd-1-like isoform X1 [Tigriopus californicus]
MENFKAKLLLLFSILVSATSGQQDQLGARLSGLQSNQRRSDSLDTIQQRNFLETNDYEYVEDVSAPRQRLRTPSSSSSSRPNGFTNNSPLSAVSDCRSKTRHRPHEKYCDLYYHTTGCDDGQALLRSCPNGLVFTGTGRPGLMGVCDYPHNVECQGTKHNPRISTEHCDWLYGIFGHETSCTRYWTCWNGTATEQFCIGGLLYNEETHACDWPQNVVGCQKHPLCKDDPNGNVRLGKSCNRYWSCQGGYPRLQRCPAMLVFNHQLKRCVNPPTDDCSVPEQQPEEEDDGNDNNNSNNNNNNNNNDGEGNGQGNRRNQNNQDKRRGGDGQPRLSQQQLPKNFQLPEGATLLSRPSS